MRTYRRVAMSMGAWKWGYPRGQRTGIAAYDVSELKSGKKVWKSKGLVCRGITASNIEWCQKTYPEAFKYPHGSLHNKPAGE